MSLQENSHSAQPNWQLNNVSNNYYFLIDSIYYVVFYSYILTSRTS